MNDKFNDNDADKLIVHASATIENWRYDVPAQTLTLYKGEIKQGSYDTKLTKNYNITLKQDALSTLSGICKVVLKQEQTESPIISDNYDIILDNATDDSQDEDTVIATIEDKTITITCGKKLKTLTNTGTIGTETRKISLLTKIMEALENLVDAYDYQLCISDKQALKNHLETLIDNVTFKKLSSNRFRLKSTPYTWSAVSISIEPKAQEDIAIQLENDTITCTMGTYYRAATINEASSDSLTRWSLSRKLAEKINELAITYNYQVASISTLSSQLDCSNVNITYNNDNYLVIQQYTWDNIVLDLSQLPEEDKTVTTTISGDEITCNITPFFPAGTINDVPFKPFTQNLLSYQVIKSINDTVLENNYTIVNLNDVQTAIDISQVEYSFTANKFVKLNNSYIWNDISITAIPTEILENIDTTTTETEATENIINGTIVIQQSDEEFDPNTTVEKNTINTTATYTIGKNFPLNNIDELITTIPTYIKNDIETSLNCTIKNPGALALKQSDFTENKRLTLKNNIVWNDVQFQRHDDDEYITDSYNVVLTQNTDDAKTYIIKGLYTQWIPLALKLIKESYGIEYKKGISHNFNLPVIFYDTVPENLQGALAWVATGFSSATDAAVSQNLNINMTYYNNIVRNQDGIPTNAYGLPLDYILAHEFTHAVMCANISYTQYASMPKWFTEGGTAEYVIGVDNIRTITNVTLNPNLLTNDDGDNPYAGGYIIMHYYTQQCVKNNIATTRQQAMQTLLQYIIDHPSENFNKAIKTCSNSIFTSADNLVQQVKNEINNAESEGYDLSDSSYTSNIGIYQFLKDKFNIIIEGKSETEDSGSITGKDSGGSTVKTIHSIMNETIPVSKWVLPDSATTKFGDLTVEWPEGYYNVDTDFDNNSITWLQDKKTITCIVGQNYLTNRSRVNTLHTTIINLLKGSKKGLLDIPNGANNIEIQGITAPPGNIFTSNDGLWSITKPFIWTNVSAQYSLLPVKSNSWDEDETTALESPETIENSCNFNIILDQDDSIRDDITAEIDGDTIICAMGKHFKANSSKSMTFMKKKLTFLLIISGVTSAILSALQQDKKFSSIYSEDLGTNLKCEEILDEFPMTIDDDNYVVLSESYTWDNLSFTITAMQGDTTEGEADEEDDEEEQQSSEETNPAVITANVIIKQSQENFNPANTIDRTYANNALIYTIGKNFPAKQRLEDIPDVIFNYIVNNIEQSFDGVILNIDQYNIFPSDFSVTSVFTIDRPITLNNIQLKFPDDDEQSNSNINLDDATLVWPDYIIDNEGGMYTDQSAVYDTWQAVVDNYIQITYPFLDTLKDTFKTLIQNNSKLSDSTYSSKALTIDGYSDSDSAYAAAESAIQSWSSSTIPSLILSQLRTLMTAAIVTSKISSTTTDDDDSSGSGSSGGSSGSGSGSGSGSSSSSRPSSGSGSSGGSSGSKLGSLFNNMFSYFQEKLNVDENAWLNEYGWFGSLLEGQKKEHEYMAANKERIPMILEYLKGPIMTNAEGSTKVSQYQSDTSNREAIVMYINPSRMQFNNQKLTQKSVTRGGIFYHHWGDDHTILSLSGDLGLSSMSGVKRLDEVYRMSGTLLAYGENTAGPVYWDGNTDIMNDVTNGNYGSAIGKVISRGQGLDDIGGMIRDHTIGAGMDAITGRKNNGLQESKVAQKSTTKVVGAMQKLTSKISGTVQDTINKITGKKKTDSDSKTTSSDTTKSDATGSILSGTAGSKMSNVANDILGGAVGAIGSKIGGKVVDKLAGKTGFLDYLDENVVTYGAAFGGFSDIIDELEDPWRPRLIWIYFEDHVYIGHFQNFNYTRDASSVNIHYELSFVIQREIIITNSYRSKQPGFLPAKIL